MTSAPTRQELLTALAQNELVYYYQPKVSFATGHICGVEALIRWHQGHRVIPPGHFIPMAERTGIIRQITLGMLPRLLQDYRSIRRIAPKVSLAFNASAHDLEHPDLTVSVCQAVERGELRRPQVELTESAVARSPQIAHHVKMLVKCGVELAMDDFGTGYSSLDTLRSLPFTVAKLDRGMVSAIAECQKSALLVKSQISLIQLLGMRTVAEGIETADVHKSLMHSGCTEAQGYWIARPMPLEALLQLLAANPSWPASHAGTLRNAHASHGLTVRMMLDWSHVAAFNPRAAQDDPMAHPPLLLQCELTSWVEGNRAQLRGIPQFDAVCQSHPRVHDAGLQVRDAVLGRAAQTDQSRLLDRLCLANAVFSRDLQCLEVAMLEQEVRCAKGDSRRSRLVVASMKNLPRRGTRTDRSRRRMARTNPDWVDQAPSEDCA